MVRESRIKEVIFPAFTITGSVRNTTFTDNAINGEILRVVVQSPTSPGSVWIGESGTNFEVFRKNNITSGTTAVSVYPLTFGNIITGNATIAGSPGGLSSIVNTELFLAASGLTSGTNKTFGPVTVYYR